jgi:hypothetical protein
MMQRFPAGEYPTLVQTGTEYILKPGYDFGDEFDFELNMMLNALTRSIPDHVTEFASDPKPNRMTEYEDVG